MTLLSNNVYTYTIHGYEQAQVIFNNSSGKQHPIANNTSTGLGVDGYYVNKTSCFKDETWYSNDNDSDCDEVFDVDEILFGTNPNNADSDSDGLPDGLEMLTIDSNPLLEDTDNDGTIDANEDEDDDGLTNLIEYHNNTSLIYTDSDDDRVTDYDEINLYGTNPNKYDTDKDGLGDGVEIEQNLNPLSVDSYNDGTIDNERAITQNYLFREQENYNSLDTVPEISITGQGDYNEDMYVYDLSSKSEYSDFDYIVGHPFEISHGDMNFDSATISFRVDESILQNNNGSDLMIAWYNEETKMYEPIETTFNAETGKLTAETNHFSVFTVIVKYLFYLAYNSLSPNSIQPTQDYYIKDSTAYWGINLRVPNKKFHTVIYEYDILANSSYYYEIIADDAYIPGAIVAPQQIRFTNCTIYKYTSKTTFTTMDYSSYMIPYSYSGQLSFVYTNRDILYPRGVGYYQTPFKNTNVKVRLSNGKWVTLLKDPRLGDNTVDSDEDGISDIAELGELKTVTFKNWLTGKNESFDVWVPVSDPTEYSIDYADVMKKAYGFLPEQTELIVSAFDKLESVEQANIKNEINNVTGVFAGLCIKYDSFRWRATANIKSRKDASDYLMKLGLSEQDVLDLVVSVNRQHGCSISDLEKEEIPYIDSKYYEKSQSEYLENTTKYPKDFTHEMYVLATFSNEDNPLRKAVDLINTDLITRKVYTNYEASIKGDIDSCRNDDGDFASDIDGINCYYIMKNSRDSMLKSFIGYNYDIQNGLKNMIREYYLNTGDGDIEQGKANMMSMLIAVTPGSVYI